MIQGENKVKGAGKGSHPNSKKALAQYMCKKGEQPPGAGRKKGTLSLKERLNKFLDLDVKIKMPSGKVEDREILDGIILSLLSQAQKGNVQAIREVFDRGFGKEADVVMVRHEDALKVLE
jgi:hypothetical protein